MLWFYGDFWYKRLWGNKVSSRENCYIVYSEIIMYVCCEYPQDIWNRCHVGSMHCVWSILEWVRLLVVVRKLGNWKKVFRLSVQSLQQNFPFPRNSFSWTSISLFWGNLLSMILLTHFQRHQRFNFGREKNTSPIILVQWIKVWNLFTSMLVFDIIKWAWCDRQPQTLLK